MSMRVTVRIDDRALKPLALDSTADIGRQVHARLLRTEALAVGFAPVDTGNPRLRIHNRRASARRVDDRLGHRGGGGVRDVDPQGGAGVSARHRPHRQSSRGPAPVPAVGAAASLRLTGPPGFNHGGDRQANRALYVIVLYRMSCNPSTRAYAESSTADGLSTDVSRPPRPLGQAE
ncbi:hypothetical protein FHU36_000866 [Nonomuraea muscovyensis]|uniref:Uncharacterized protein n=1 Tax=Nonomuraea muscovyensis TaxID=1124761 RepID=A0A7X0EU41_9ACTN|nr:hypothetical protein [Nonomuraea muscovyensis]MBB6344357.1 hypothetical protein [Nonomuraea muscovyensis]